MKTRKTFYEKFHRNSKKQHILISKFDFTYGTILQILKRYGRNTHLKILDIGCGVGSVDLYLASLGNDVLGIDISALAVKKAADSAKYLRIEKAKFKAVDFFKLPLKNSYDIIICSEVLEHLKEDKLAVSKIKKLLKHKGILIASSPSLSAPLFRLGMLHDFDTKVGHLRRYSETTFKKLFTDSEFKVLKIKKTEGILRNFLFTNSFGAFSLRLLKRFPFSNFITFFDNLTVSVFGESNIYIVVQKK